MLRAQPFQPLRSVLGYNGDRWVPIHGVLPLSKALPAVLAIEALIARHASAMQAHGIISSPLTANLDRAFLYEPCFYWPDQIKPLHVDVLGESLTEPWRSRPAAPAALALVTQLWQEVAEALDGFGAVHFQLGRAYADLPGDTLVVSAASGPVGATVGQLAKAAGCRVVGIAGGPEKCTWVTGTAGFDACIDHHAVDLRTALKTHCPSGVDVYFDNVGGVTLQAVAEHLALNARVVLCGLISQYSAGAGSVPPAGPNPGLFIKARATVRGLVVYDHWADFEHMVDQLVALQQSGQMHFREDISHRLASTPQAFARLMRGANQGKALVLL